LFWTHLLLICGLCLFAGSAGAQQPSQAQANAIKQSCRSDYQSYCASVPTGGSASLQCLQQHVSELSSPCQSAVNAVSGGGGASRPPAAAAQSAPPPAAAVPPMSPRQEMAMLRGACGGDYRAYCRGVPLGGGNAMACLAQNQARLSRPCKTALAEARAAR
jgi:hypothetical protein